MSDVAEGREARGFGAKSSKVELLFPFFSHLNSTRFPSVRDQINIHLYLHHPKPLNLTSTNFLYLNSLHLELNSLALDHSQRARLTSQTTHKMPTSKMNSSTESLEGPGKCVICGEETFERCSACSTHGLDWMFFCGQDHQKLVSSYYTLLSRGS